MPEPQPQPESPPAEWPGAQKAKDLDIKDNEFLMRVDSSGRVIGDVLGSHGAVPYANRPVRVQAPPPPPPRITWLGRLRARIRSMFRGAL